jgi:hypothetical protein
MIPPIELPIRITGGRGHRLDEPVQQYPGWRAPWQSIPTTGHAVADQVVGEQLVSAGSSGAIAAHLTAEPLNPCTHTMTGRRPAAEVEVEQRPVYVRPPVFAAEPPAGSVGCWLAILGYGHGAIPCP